MFTSHPLHARDQGIHASHLLEKLDEVRDDLLSSKRDLPTPNSRSAVTTSTSDTLRVFASPRTFIAWVVPVVAATAITIAAVSFTAVPISDEEVFRLVSLHDVAEVFQVHFVVVSVEFCLHKEVCVPSLML